MGLHDMVSKLWIIRRDSGLDVEGYTDEVSAIGALVRRSLVRNSQNVEAQKAAIMAAVEKALTHLDDVPEHSEEGWR